MRDIEKSSRNGPRTSTLVCFLAGFTTGVAATLLFAPASGDATRSRISKNLHKGEDWVRDQAALAEDRIRARGEDLLDRAKDVREAIARP